MAKRIQKNNDVHHHGNVSRMSRTLIKESLYKYEHNDVTKTNIRKTRMICLKDGPVKWEEWKMSWLAGLNWMSLFFRDEPRLKWCSVEFGDGPSIGSTGEDEDDDDDDEEKVTTTLSDIDRDFFGLFEKCRGENWVFVNGKNKKKKKKKKSTYYV